MEFVVHANLHCLNALLEVDDLAGGIEGLGMVVVEPHVVLYSANTDQFAVHMYSPRRCRR